METYQELVDRQKAIEQDAVALGQTRYRGERAMPWQGDDPAGRGETDQAPGKLLLKQYVEPVSEALVTFLEGAFAGKAGRLSRSAPYLAHVDPLQAAYLGLRFGINGASAGKSFTNVALSIGTAIQEHLEMLKMSQQHPGLHRKLTRQLARSTSAQHRLGVLRHVREKYDLEKMNWSKAEKIQIGAKLIELMVEATPLFEIALHSQGKNKTTQFLQFTSDTVEWLEKTHGRCELLSPVYLPMIVPPRKWRTPFSGGYLTDALRPKMVHTRNRNHLDELGGVDLSDVMKAINAIQETPWRVSTKILDVIDVELDAHGGGSVGLPRRSSLPLPPRPASVPEGVPTASLTALQREDLTVWKGEAAKIHVANAKNEQDRVGLAQKLYVSRRFAAERAIYFPHYMDFRGRVYPLAAYLSPQGDDLSRGLLEFADGKPLGEDGAFWLAVHIAGLWGVDKVSFEDRFAWVKENEDAILAAALSPHDDNAFWRTAEKPWQALAACFDWLGYSLNGNDHVSHLPIAMDGSCSGLQHYSALLRDPVGGCAVNLIPGKTPADVYLMVADRAQILSDGFLGGTSDEMARAWRGKFVRKITKQPTMTLCYSATKFGMKQQIESALRKLDEDGPFLDPSVDRYKAAIYAADIIWEALEDTVVAASGAMEWLKRVSDVVVEADMPIRWTSPIGLPVLQDYRDQVGKRVKVFVGGQRMDLVINEDAATRSKRRQSSGIAPNFVHSLDASHLLNTVNLATMNGIHHFAMIHDSFGCHAADTTLMNAVLRESFVDQYSQPVLERFREDIVDQLNMTHPELAEKIPALPASGSLDLEAVKDSEFFFA